MTLNIQEWEVRATGATPKAQPEASAVAEAVRESVRCDRGRTFQMF